MAERKGGVIFDVMFVGVKGEERFGVYWTPSSAYLPTRGAKGREVAPYILPKQTYSDYEMLCWTYSNSHILESNRIESNRIVLNRFESF